MITANAAVAVVSAIIRRIAQQFLTPQIQNPAPSAFNTAGLMVFSGVLYYIYNRIKLGQPCKVSISSRKSNPHNHLVLGNRNLSTIAVATRARRRKELLKTASESLNCIKNLIENRSTQTSGTLLSDDGCSDMNRSSLESGNCLSDVTKKRSSSNIGCNNLKNKKRRNYTKRKIIRRTRSNKVYYIL